MPRGFAAGLIARLGRPLAAPSANRSGRISATTAQAVADDLGDRIRLVVDGGPTPVGVESTIVKVEDGAVRLLRPGGVTVEEIEAVAGRSLSGAGAAGIEAPGMMTSHYAPGAAVRLECRACRAGRGSACLRPAPRSRFRQCALQRRNLSATRRSCAKPQPISSSS